MTQLLKAAAMTLSFATPALAKAPTELVAPTDEVSSPTALPVPAQPSFQAMEAQRKFQRATRIRNTARTATFIGAGMVAAGGTVFVLGVGTCLRDDACDGPAWLIGGATAYVGVHVAGIAAPVWAVSEISRNRRRQDLSVALSPVLNPSQPGLALNGRF